MRIEVTPRQAEVVPGIPQPVVVTIANTSTVIGGYELRVLGADPSWVQLDTDRVSMFPDETRTLTATVAVPPGIPAGTRRIAVQVRELTPPYSTAVAEIDLTVPSAKSVTARLDPIAVTAGRTGRFTVLVENGGNTLVRAELAAEEPEGRVRFRFEPEAVTLAPGEHAVVDMIARGKRPFSGAPAPRMVSVYLDELPEDGFFADAAPPPKHEENNAAANGMFVQKSLLSRGPLSLVGLIAAITVFAIIITIAMSRLVGQSAADRNLALQVAAAQASNAAASGTSGLSGTVRLLTSGKPVSGVSVAVYLASDTSQPVATTATNASGGYVVTNLDAGQYKVTFRGASFLQLWYPGAATASDASSVRLGIGQIHTGLDVTVGGVPATVSGTVSGDDLAGATLYLEKTVRNGSAAGNSTVVPAPLPGQTVAPVNGDAVVKTVPLGSDGSFSLTDVPSPSRYVLVLAKPGYATSTQTIDVGAGEIRNSVALTLRKGDGVISGTITSAGGALGGATISATTGTTSASTVSLTENPAGSFTLRNLPTPGTYTVVASKEGFASQTLTLTLSAGQKLTGVSMTLGASSGTLGGTASLVQSDHSADTRAAGVAVVVTDGSLTVQTETQSIKPIGAWKVAGLPIPGTYTVTFSRADLATQTVSVSLDSAGNIITGSQGTSVTSSRIAVRMRQSTATVLGRVTQPNGARTCDSSDHLGEAVVTLAAGTVEYKVTTASVPSGQCGAYEFDNIPAGTYTLTVSAGGGTIPNSQPLSLTAGERIGVPVLLGRPASIVGKVIQPIKSGSTPDPSTWCGWTVFLYQTSSYPTTITARATTKTLSGSAGCNNFSFPRVDAGSYILAVGPTSNPVNVVATTSIVVQPGQSYGTTKATRLWIVVNPHG